MVLDQMLGRKAPSTLDQMISKKASCGASHGKPKKKVNKKALKKLSEKMAAWQQPAEQILKLEGSQSDKARQALDALCELTPERDHPLKEAEEKVAIYSDPGEKVHVKSGPHKGKNGLVVAKKRVRHEERWLDDEGSDNRKDKTDESYTVEFEGNTQVTFDKPDEELEYYNEDTDEKEARAKLAQAFEKTAYGGSIPGPYYSLGDKAKCKDGEHKGQTGVVTKIIEHDESSSKLDEDGAVNSRSKNTRKVTIKFEGGETAEVDASKTERKHDDDDGAPDDAPVEVTAGERDELVETVEKIGRILSQRILNGDVGLQTVIDAFATPKEAKSECDTPGEKKRSKGKGRGLARGKGPMGVPAGEKKADSDTVPGKVQKNETQEGVEPYPRGDDKPPAEGLTQLRVEDKPSNITEIDKAIDEAQDTDK